MRTLHIVPRALALLTAFSVPILMSAVTQTPAGGSQRLSGTWNAELWRDNAPMDSLTAFRITVVLESIPGPKGLGGRYTFHVQLGHDPIRTLFGHPDDCVRSEGELTVKQTADTLQIVFTPWSRDCGLSAQGTVAGSVFVGRWHEPSFTGTGASGPIRMQRINAKRR